MSRGIYESRIYRWLEVVSSFLFLNLVWLVACLPLVTVYPATAAMFAVVRKWVREGEFDGAIRGFFSFLRRDFLRSFLVGLVWTLSAAILAVNWALIPDMPEGFRVPLYAFFVALGFVYAAAFVFLFPVLAHFETGVWGATKNSLLLAVSRLPTAICALVVLVTAVAATSVFPLVVLFVGSVASYAIYWLCQRSFTKIEELRASETGGQPHQSGERRSTEP